MASLALDPTTPLRVIPDVHGNLEAFATLVDEARGAGRFIVQIGDLVDRGPDSAGALALMLDLIEAGEGVATLGNHDWKIVRHLQGRPVTLKPEQEETLAQMARHPGLAARFLALAERMTLYWRWRDWLFAHAGHDPAMTEDEALCVQAFKRLQARALYGETTGRRDPKGRPERVYDWVDRAPAGLNVIIGHDWRGPGVVLRRVGAGGAVAHLLDLGCGKGGPLAHADLDPDGTARFSHPVADWVGATYEFCPLTEDG